MTKAELFRGRAGLARDVLGAVVEAAASDCRDAMVSKPALATAVRGASAAAFFLSDFGQGVIRDLVGEAGVRAGKALAAQALDALDLTPRAVKAISAAEWEVAIERTRLPATLTEMSARPLRLVG
jgi:hypothetical protein